MNRCTSYRLMLYLPQNVLAAADRLRADDRWGRRIHGRDDSGRNLRRNLVATLDHNGQHVLDEVSGVLQALVHSVALGDSIIESRHMHDVAALRRGEQN